MTIRPEEKMAAIRGVMAVVVWALGIGLAATPASAAPTADVSAAATCQEVDTTRVTGGYEALLSCSNSLGYVHGFGTTLSAARAQANLIVELYDDTGMDCDGVKPLTVRGGYRVMLSCSRVGYVDGFGTTLTDAAQNARLLASLHPAGALDCSGVDAFTATGGYEVTLSCHDNLGYVDAFGTSVSDAQEEAILLAKLYIDKRRDCTGVAVSKARGGGYEVTLSCSHTGYVDGIGATVTQAARNARLLASAS